jgi:membrane-associated phospholipid phosphatase
VTGGGGRQATRRVQPWHVAMGLYGVLLALYVVVVGIPLDRGLQAVWLIAGMAAWQVGRSWRQWVRMLADWVPFIAALVVYDHTRGVADTLGRPVLVGGLAEAEMSLFGGVLPTIVLQERFYDPLTAHWFDLVAALVYFSHFIVPWAVAALLYVLSREAWLGYARRIFTLTYAGLVTYVLLPAAPPWFAAREGLVEEVDRVATRGWSAMGLHGAGRLLERGQADVNLVAALPSLHAGTSMLVVLWAWPLVRSAWARAGLAAYAVSMALTLVYGGEHYVLDVLMGWAYAALAVGAWWLWERRSLRREPVSAAVAAARTLGADVVAGRPPRSR